MYTIFKRMKVVSEAGKKSAVHFVELSTEMYEDRRFFFAISSVVKVVHYNEYNDPLRVHVLRYFSRFVDRGVGV